MFVDNLPVLWEIDPGWPDPAVCHSDGPDDALDQAGHSVVVKAAHEAEGGIL